MRFAAPAVLTAIVMTGCAAVAQNETSGEKNWIARSNQYTNLLIDINNKHQPEGASQQGLAQYDALIGQPTKQDSDAQIAETRVVLATLHPALLTEKNKDVVEDLKILIHSNELG